MYVIIYVCMYIYIYAYIHLCVCIYVDLLPINLNFIVGVHRKEGLADSRHFAKSDDAWERVGDVLEYHFAR